jgi:ubiquinone/menaquinone biosynthesis C-methylase UbiE
MERGVRYGEMLLGVEGLALLRLHAGYHSGDVDDVVTELRSVLELLDEVPFDRAQRGAEVGVSDGYARWAEVYDLPDNPVVEHEQPTVWALFDRSPGEVVLDAGCGTGRHLAHLAALGRQVIGVDLSAKMLAVASGKVPGADLREGDVCALPVADDAVAGVVCALALEHVADLTRAYAELARVVVPGGWVIVSTLHPTIATVAGWHAWFVDGEGRGDVVTYPHSVSDYFSAALRAGLRLVEITEPTMTEDFSARSAPEVASTGSVIAHRDLPLILVSKFEVPEQ